MLFTWSGVQIKQGRRMKFFLIVFMLFILGALFIISNNNLLMFEKENVSEFVDLYINWVDNIYQNTKLITGNIVKQDWLPGKV